MRPAVPNLSIRQRWIVAALPVAGDGLVPQAHEIVDALARVR
jgi:hypothetical protein